jgi:hypothetical protein
MTNPRWPEVSGWVQLHSHTARPGMVKVVAPDEENTVGLRHRELGCGGVGQALHFFLPFEKQKVLSVPFLV